MVREGVVFDLEVPAGVASDAVGHTEGALGAETSLEIHEVNAEPALPLDQWPRDALADALRVRMVTGNGDQYLQREPNWAGADEILSGRRSVPVHRV